MKRTSSIAFGTILVGLLSLELSACAGRAVHDERARDPATADDGGTKNDRRSQGQSRKGFTKSETPSPWVGFYYSWQEKPISTEAHEALRREGVSDAKLESACRKLARTKQGYAWKNGQCLFVREDFAVIREVPAGLQLTINNVTDCRMEFLLSKASKRPRDVIRAQQPGGRCQVAVEMTNEKLTVRPLTSAASCSCPGRQGVFPVVVSAHKADLRNFFSSAETADYN